MPKHNTVIPNVHFHKYWERHIKTWFNQPANKLRRRNKRAAKAAAIFPRPVAGLLRPIVHCPTQRYNMRRREGRGFTYRELKLSGINRIDAKNIGIAVDRRRRNKSLQSLRNNVSRLKAFKAKLLVFPTENAIKKAKRVERANKRWADPVYQQKRADKKAKREAKLTARLAAKGRERKPKKAAEPVDPKAKAKTKVRRRKRYATAEQMAKAVQYKKRLFPIRAFQEIGSFARALAPEEKYGKGAYFALRDARSAARLVGVRKKKAEKWAAKLALKKAKSSA